jgi:asparagine synthase (glutamine-hydrolysing)
MCGISGIFNYRNSLNRETLASNARLMTEEMVHRGPDDHGLWISEQNLICMGHRRLSIIDLNKNAAQPLHDYSKRYVITFNGEIYNYLDLKTELINLNYKFKTNSDTEVLLISYIEWGVDCVKKFDGMFAFVIYDNEEKNIFAARDPFGEKPFYYTQGNNCFAFASELTALSKFNSFDKTISSSSVTLFLANQYVPAPYTIFEKAYKLPPGHTLKCDIKGKIETNKYYSFTPSPLAVADRSLDDYTDELEELLTNSIEKRMLADVPVGTFLSGGIDSSLVSALISKKLGITINTFSIGFSNFTESEHVKASLISRDINSEHNELILESYDKTKCKLIYEMLDEPNGDSSIYPTWSVSNFAVNKVKVAISGDGADELFAGYNRYNLQLYKDQGNNSERILHKYLLDLQIFNHNELNSFVRNYDFEVLKANACIISQNRELGELSWMRKVDVEQYLPGAVLSKVDRTSMMNSLEVRTPFLNREIARFAEKIPEKFLRDGSEGKIILRNLLSRYLDKKLIDKNKYGFGTPNNKIYFDLLKERIYNYGQSFPKSFFWFSKPKKELIHHYDGNIYKANTINSLASFLNSNEFKVTTNLNHEKILDINYLNITKEKTLYVHDNLIPHNFLQSGLKFKRIIIDYSEKNFDLESKIHNFKDFKTLILDLEDTDITIEIAANIHAIKGNLEIYFHINNKWTKYIEYISQNNQNNRGYIFDYHSFEIRSDVVRNFRTQIFKHLNISKSSNSKKERLFQRKSNLFSKKNFYNLFILLKEVREYLIFHRIERKVINSLEELKQNPSTFENRETKKVLLVIATLQAGGAERQIVNTAKVLKKDGYDVYILLINDRIAPHPPYLETLIDSKIKIIDSHVNYLIKDEHFRILSKLPNYLRGWTFRVYNAIKQTNPDVIHSFLDWSNIITGIASVIHRHQNTNLSFRCTSPNNLEGHRIWYKRYYKMLEGFNTIKLSGNSIKGNYDYAKWLNLKSRIIHYTPNILLSSIKSYNREESFKIINESDPNFQITLDDFIIGGIFRLDDQKCPHLFIETLAMLKECKIQFKSIVVGDGPLYSKCKALLNKYSLMEYVNFVGRKSDVSRYYSVFDIFMLTSRQEGTPNVLIEAQSLGLPCVTTDVGACSEVVIHNKTGLVVKPNNPNALMNACLEMVTNPKKMKAFSQNAIEHSKRVFSPANGLDHFNKLYSARN